MRVQVHTKLCFLCVLTFLLHQSSHCHEQVHSRHHGGHDHSHSGLQISQAPYVKGAPLAPESSSPHRHSLEEEQRFYIQQLFNRYGRNGRLDFHGFQSLLFSLGLGEVKVVGGKHDELGHDHVSHLDLLDAQGGLQMPSPVTEGQSGYGNSPGHPHHDHGSYDPHSPGHPHHDHGSRDPHSPGHPHYDHSSHDAHSPGHPHYDHSSHDAHSLGHPHHDHGSHDLHTEPDPQGCNQQSTADTPVEGRPAGDELNHGNDLDHNHHHHDHDHDTDHNHTKVEDHALNQDNGRVQESLKKNDKHEPTQVQSHKIITADPQNPHNHNNHDDNGHADHQHGDHNDHQHSNDENHQHGDHQHDHSDHNHNDIHRVQTGTVIPNSKQDQKSSLQEDSSLVQPEASTSTAVNQPKRPKEPVQIRVQKRRNKIYPPPSMSGYHGHQSEHSHDHQDDAHRNTRKEKREVSGGPGAPSLPATVLPLNHSELDHQHEECLNLTLLLHYYGLNPDSSISPSQFTYLCPALLYHIDSRVCIRHYQQMNEEQKPLEHALVWLWGFVSITIISLLSLLGVVLIPFLRQSCFKFLLTFLVALAVGTLSGDALLHLLPHSKGNHDHNKHGHGHDTHLHTDFDAVWKGLMALGGIYLLFIIEHCIGMFKHYKDHRVLKKVNKEGKIGRKLSDHKLNRRSDAEWLHLKPLSEDPETCSSQCNNSHNDTQLAEIHTPQSPANKLPLDVSTQKKEQKAKHHGHSHSHGHSHGGNCHSDQEMKDAGIASIAWMVIMGDGMHNLSDGLAIGAAFSAHLTGGISTSVAVFCHELPHELGDFAVLLKAGMSVKQAIVYNLLSALMAYVGMVIGTAVGQYTENVTSWIFAITAGMFLYVALVDMLPEMLHGDSEDYKRCQLGHFILQNLGMLTGFAIMLLIAIFEDQIVFDFTL